MRLARSDYVPFAVAVDIDAQDASVVDGFWLVCERDFGADPIAHMSVGCDALVISWRHVIVSHGAYINRLKRAVVEWVLSRSI